MKKYRIVKTENGDYKIQKQILFGTFWIFAKEPIVSYLDYIYGYEFDTNELFSYNSISEAKRAIFFLKQKKLIIYRGFVIRLMKTNLYVNSKNEYRYFVKPRFAKFYFASFSYTLLEDAKSYVDATVDAIHKDAEEYDKRYKVKEVVEYY